MDGRGRIAQPLTWLAQWRALLPALGRAVKRPRVRRNGTCQARAPGNAELPPSRLARWLRRSTRTILNVRLPRGVGIAAATLLVVASLAYGVVRGDHITTIVDTLKDVRDSAANAAGFRIVSLAMTGQQHVSREEVLAIAGVTDHTSLLFLDVEAARERLKTNPWVADATVLKLYPGELQIGITEREPFALWQKEGRISVIADDGTVLEPYVAPRLLRLPLVVGRGAETKAKEFLALVGRYPEIGAQVRASVLIGERRWNLRLKNGLDVRLPEDGIGPALERLVALDREVKLISRDIASIDLRLPDRVTVRLSGAAAQARSDALKDKKPPAKKGGAA
jgi:cell division protein FtsQ